MAYAGPMEQELAAGHGGESDPASELADLRRRAYGPREGAHADLDDSERARLAALEAVTSESGHGTDASDEDSNDRSIGPATQPLDRPDTAAASPDRAEGRDHPGAARLRQSSVRAVSHRARPLSALLIGLALGLMVGLTIPVVAEPQPDITLAETDVAPDPMWEIYLNHRDVAVESMQAHEMLYGALMVWTATADSGLTCLLTGHARPTGLSLDVCTGGDQDPTLDLVVTDHLRELFGGRHPTGTLLRLVGRDDAVDVYVLDSPDQRSGGPS